MPASATACRRPSLDQAALYSNILFGGAIPFWILLLLQLALRGTGNVKVPAMIILGGAVAGLILDAVMSGMIVTALTAAAGGVSVAAIAGYGIASRLDMLLVPVMFGFGTAAITLVGTNLGAGNVARAAGGGGERPVCCRRGWPGRTAGLNLPATLAGLVYQR